MKFYTKGLVFMKLRWKGWVPAEYISVNGDQFEVHLGRLGVDGDYLTPGNKTLVEATVNRNSGTHSVEMFYSRRDTVQ